MEGRLCPEGMTPEQFEEAQRVFEVSRHAAEEELWRMACLTASKKDAEILGETEFQLRDILLRIGARTLEATVNERRKKGGTRVAVFPAVTASTTRVSSTGGRKRS
jgi:hypothetical protein